MSLAAPLAYPFFQGAGLSDEVPGKWDVALNGRNFMVDWKFEFTRQSIGLLKPQQDDSGNVSEASLNPEEFARRAAESWHHGAGQTRLDRDDSDPFRYRASKGVDVWSKHAMTLLNATASKLVSANTNLYLAVAGARLYLTDGAALKYTTDITTGTPTWTTVTGTPATAANGIASDGFNVFTAHAASGIYRTDTSSGSTASFNTRAANGIIGYVKGRLMVSNDNVLVNVTDVATETILLTHPNSSFRWTCVTEGPGQIYVGGFAGDKSLIYKTAVEQDALALASPTVAGELPDGEIIRSIQGYLGFLLVGTDKGLRLMSLNANGDVDSSGKIISTTAAVYCFEPQDRFVWYALTNYDSTSTGLGRADLGEFTDALTPAFASDLMATAQGAVQAVATFQNIRVFTVSGSGVHGETTSKVSSGTLESGLVGYGLPDTKVAMGLDTRFGLLPSGATVVVSISTDSGSFITLGTADTANLTSLITPAGQYRAETFEVRVTMTGSGSSAPAVSRWTLEANPAPGRGEFIEIPLRLFEKLKTATGSEETIDVAAHIDALLSMERLGAPVNFQDALGTETVFLDDHRVIVDSYTIKRDSVNCTYVVRARRPRERN